MPYSIIDLGQHYFMYWLVNSLVPSNYLNQSWLIIVNWTLKTNFSETRIKHVLENVFCKSIAIMFRFDYINTLWLSDDIWWGAPWSTLAQVMAYWLIPPSHYLYQCFSNIMAFICLHFYRKTVNKLSLNTVYLKLLRSPKDQCVKPCGELPYSWWRED